MFLNNIKKAVAANPNNAIPNNDYQITLNFVPVDTDLPAFSIYRKLRSTEQEVRLGENMKAYKLPVSLGDATSWLSYWVTFENMSNFELFQASPTLPNP